jgi:AraC family transcriptional regulator
MNIRKKYQEPVSPRPYDEVVKENNRNSYRDRIQRVLLYIEAHQDEALSLDELARVANFSPFHFHRIFSGMVGETVKEYLRRLRLERAAYQLRITRQPVVRIALDAGFETHESFTRAFQTKFHSSPSEYRKNCCGAEASVAVMDRDPDGWPLLPADERRCMEVQIKRLQPTRVAFVRHVGPYAEVGKAWGRLCGWAGPKGILGPSCAFLGLSYDDPDITAPDKLRYDAAVVVGPETQGEGEIWVQEIPGGDYAVTMHRGPYEKMSETYRAIFGQWLPNSGREPGPAPTLEFYRNDPCTTKPEELLTEVWVPLA